MQNGSRALAWPSIGFGDLLRRMRSARRLSQLDVAAAAQVSARHLCFLERGRAHPSRDMVHRLGLVLDLPLEERNALHVAAGFVPPYGNRSLDASDLQPVREALAFVLQQQEPYPALVIDSRWNVCMRNEASRRVLAPFRSAYEMEPDLVDNAMHVVFHPRGLRQFMVNWAEFARCWLQLLDREISQGSQHAALLRDEILRYPGVSDVWQTAQPAIATGPLMTMQLRTGDQELALFSTLTTFAAPQDVTLQQLKIECFYPADESTRVLIGRLAKSRIEEEITCNPLLQNTKRTT